MQKYELNLYDYWRIIRRRRKIIFIATGVLFIVTLFYVWRQEPVYQSVVRLKMSSSAGAAAAAGGGAGMDMFSAWYPQEFIRTEAQIVLSRSVFDEALRRLGRIAPELTYQQKEELIQSVRNRVSTKQGAGNVLEIMVNSSQSREAQALANIIARVYLDRTGEERNIHKRYLRETIAEQVKLVRANLERAEENLLRYRASGNVVGVRDSYASRLQSLRMELGRLSKMYTEKHPKIVSIRDEIKYLELEINSLSQSELVAKRLERELRVNEELYNLLNRRYKEALISESERFESASIIEPASLPRTPLRARQLGSVVLGIIVGLLIGTIFALVLENLDTSIATIEDMEGYLQVPVLGVIPHMEMEGEAKGIFARLRKTELEGERSHLAQRLIIYYQPKSPIAESYRTLETNVKFALANKKPYTVMFTSTGLQEGKSITVANYALACAQSGSGERVVLIEADLRRPALHRIFGLEQTPGLTDILVGRIPWQEVIRGTTDILLGDLDRDKLLRLSGLENLKIIPSGVIPPNPVEMLNSDRLKELMEELKSQFDIVIFDCAPLLPVADSIVLAPKVTGTVIVYRVGRTVRGALRRTKLQLQSSGANVLGIVLNDIRAAELEAADYYHYYYRYYSQEEKKPTPRWEDMTWGERIREVITRTVQLFKPRNQALPRK